MTVTWWKKKKIYNANYSEHKQYIAIMLKMDISDYLVSLLMLDRLRM